jgi:hypothetical protein
MRCGLSDGNVYDAVIVGIDPVGDLALIRLLGRDDFPFAEMGDSNTLRAGQWCFVVGNPFLLATNLQPTVTWGMLSGVNRYQYPAGTLLEYADCLQTDASINPGNSGGPIYDASGKLIGIVGRCSFEKRGRVNVGVGYAISINQAKNFLGVLKSGRIVDHATLGATVVTDPEGGVRVSNILPTSDAYRRGLRYNDEILEIAGRIVQTANDVKNVLGTLPKGWRVPLVYAREGKRKEILVRLAGVHTEDELLEKMATALPPPPPAPPAPAEPKESDGEQAEGEAEKDDETQLAADGKPIPEVAAKLLEERKGYANYFFNRQQQQRVVQGLSRRAPVPAEAGSVWRVTGVTSGGNETEVEIVVGDMECRMRFGKAEYQLESVVDRFERIDSRSVEAMAIGLELWRRLLVLGPDKFGECYYEGTGPFLGSSLQYDMLIGISGELESRFIVHPDKGVLNGIEIVGDRGSDPAELIVIWEESSADDATFLRPQSLELRFGADVLMSLSIKAWTNESSEAGK